MAVKPGMEGMYIQGMIPVVTKYKTSIENFQKENLAKLGEKQRLIYDCIQGSQTAAMDAYFQNMANAINELTEVALGSESTVVTALDEAMEALKNGDEESKAIYDENVEAFHNFLGVQG